MDYAADRSKFYERVREGRALLSLIKEMESTATPPVDSDAVKMMRGLFYVNTYGMLERSMNELFAGFLSSVAQLGVGAHQYVHTFLPVAMDGHFSSLADPVAKRRFIKRVDFAAALHRNEVVELNSSIFESQLQNTKASVIADIFKAIGADATVVEHHSKKTYINEIAEKRNQVAHGRATAKEVGSSGRSSDLEIRLIAVEEFYESVAQFLEGYFNCRAFLIQQR